MIPHSEDRYSRQILFSGIGAEGQIRLQSSSVVIVGCGALGSFHAGALARAGIGRLRLIDRDYVELSNLQRQWLFDEEDARQALPKAAAAAAQIGKINSEVRCDVRIADLTPGNADELLGEADLILDGTDNFETRYLINDFAVSQGVPWIYGAAVGSYGLVMPVVPEQTACLRCIYPEPPSGDQPTCETAGVLNTITSVIASLQVSLAYRLLLGEKVLADLTTIDLWTGRVRQVAAPARDAECPCCGKRQFDALDGHHRAPISLCGRNAVQIHEKKRPLDFEKLARKLTPLGEIRSNEFALRFFTENYEMTFFPDGRAIIKGTTDPGVARSLYAQYIGS